MFKSKRGKWQDQDEYTKARFAYEGEAAGATKASWLLGFGFVVMAGIAAVNTMDKHDLANLGGVKFVAMETNRTTGDIVSVNPVSGEILLPDTQKRRFLKYWIKLLRTVPNDQPAYADAFLMAQVYASDPVVSFLHDVDRMAPVGKFIQNGGSRMAKVLNVTPLGNGVTYQVDWEETVYKNNRPVGLPIPMTANLDLIQYEPTNNEEAEINMFGLRIEGMRWTPPASVFAP